MKKFDIFKKIYGNCTFFGCRVTKRSLNEFFHDKEFVDEAIEKLFIECPTKFPGEYKNEKHYLLKPIWQILKMVQTTNEVIKYEPKRSLYYIWWLFRDIFNLPSDMRFYMHPTAVTRHERFFLTLNINF